MDYSTTLSDQDRTRTFRVNIVRLLLVQTLLLALIAAATTTLLVLTVWGKAPLSPRCDGMNCVVVIQEDGRAVCYEEGDPWADCQPWERP